MMQFHPIAELVPGMTDEEFQDLKASIQENGLRLKIIFDRKSKSIIDGRHRYRALRELLEEGQLFGEAAEIKNWFQEFEGGDILDYVVDANVNRRHWTPGQLAMFGAQIANLKPGWQHRSVCTASAEAVQHEDNPFDGVEHSEEDEFGPISETEVAKKIGVSRSSVQRAGTILDSGDGSLIKEVMDGAIPLNTAIRKLRADEDEFDAPPMSRRSSRTTYLLDDKIKLSGPRNALEQRITIVPSSLGKGHVITIETKKFEIG